MNKEERVKEYFTRMYVHGDFSVLDKIKEEKEKKKNERELVLKTISEIKKLNAAVPGLCAGGENDLENINLEILALDEIEEKGPNFKEELIKYKKAFDIYKNEILSVKNECNLDLGIIDLMQKTAYNNLGHLSPPFPKEDIAEKYPEIYAYYESKGGIEKRIELFDERKYQGAITRKEVIGGLAKEKIAEHFDQLLLTLKPNRSQNNWPILLKYVCEEKINVKGRGEKKRYIKEKIKQEKYIKERIDQAEKSKPFDEKISEKISFLKNKYMTLADLVNEVREKINIYNERRNKGEKAIPRLKQAEERFLENVKDNLIFNNRKKYENYYGKSEYLGGAYIFMEKNKEQEKNIMANEENDATNEEAEAEIAAGFKIINKG